MYQLDGEESKREFYYLTSCNKNNSFENDYSILH